MTISVVRLAGAFLLAVADAAMAQYAGPPIIIQTPTQLNGATTLKPLTGQTLKDLPKAPTHASAGGASGRRCALPRRLELLTATQAGAPRVMRRDPA